MFGRRISPEAMAKDALAAMTPEQRAVFATQVLTAIDDPQMCTALMGASRLIQQHALELARAAFEKECD